LKKRTHPESRRCGGARPRRFANRFTYSGQPSGLAWGHHPFSY
jgi:hypothetical protein